MNDYHEYLFQTFIDLSLLDALYPNIKEDILNLIYEKAKCFIIAGYSIGGTTKSKQCFDEILNMSKVFSEWYSKLPDDKKIDKLFNYQFKMMYNERKNKL